MSLTINKKPTNAGQQKIDHHEMFGGFVCMLCLELMVVLTSMQSRLIALKIHVVGWWFAALCIEKRSGKKYRFPIKNVSLQKGASYFSAHKASGAKPTTPFKTSYVKVFDDTRAGLQVH